MKKRIISTILILGLIAGIWNTTVFAQETADDPKPDTVSVEPTVSIVLNRTSATLDIGQSITLSVKNKPADAAVVYSSGSGRIASVNSKGIVKAKAAGTATIYAECSGVTAFCKITVRKSTLRVNPKIETIITQGSENYITGAVRSNRKITKVAAQIIGKRNRKVYYSKTVKPNRTSYKLTGAIDRAMRFDRFRPGTYIFRVTAWDTAGNKVRKEIECTVKAKTKEQLKLEQHIRNIDRKVKRTGPLTSYNNYCGEYVYQVLRAKGIYTGKKNRYERAVDGNQWYNLVKNKKYTKSTGKYLLEKYGGKQSLDKLTNSGKKTVYNIVVSYKDGIGSGKPYGHVVFIHAIIDGKVYYSESFNMFGKTAGEPITVDYSTFNRIYNYYFTAPLGAIAFLKS